MYLMIRLIVGITQMLCQDFDAHQDCSEVWVHIYYTSVAAKNTLDCNYLLLFLKACNNLQKIHNLKVHYATYLQAVNKCRCTLKPRVYICIC